MFPFNPLTVFHNFIETNISKLLLAGGLQGMIIHYVSGMYEFLGQTNTGMVVDIDIEPEKCRWMGSAQLDFYVTLHKTKYTYVIIAQLMHAIKFYILHVIHTLYSKVLIIYFFEKRFCISVFVSNFRSSHVESCDIIILIEYIHV